MSLIGLKCPQPSMIGSIGSTIMWASSTLIHRTIPENHAWENLTILGIGKLVGFQGPSSCGEFGKSVCNVIQRPVIIVVVVANNSTDLFQRQCCC